MSTLGYAAFTNARDRAPAGTSTDTNKPGVGTYLDALAALVPAEALSLHAVILTATTGPTADGKGTQVTAPDTLWWAFFGLLVVAAGFYVGPRLVKGRWDGWDYLRAIIPPAAFVGWAMLQRVTAFDAVCPDLPAAPRTVIALFLGVALGAAASLLAYKADQKT